MNLKSFGACVICICAFSSIFAGLWMALIDEAHAQPRSIEPTPIAPDLSLSPVSSTACAISNTKEGIDVSHYDGSINWAQVAAAGKAFAYTKISEGTNYTDSTYITNYTGIKNARMLAGGYMYFHANQDPVLQANLFISKLLQAGFAPGDLAPAIDMETNDGQVSTTLASNLFTTVTTIRNTLHITPVIYTYNSFWNQYISPTQFAAYFGSDPLWIGVFTSNCPTLPSGWTTWTVWQYSDTGTVPGIAFTGSVDLDRSNGAHMPTYLATHTFLPIVLD